MLEKLLLASILTFSFSLFADIGGYYGDSKVQDNPGSNRVVFNFTQELKSTARKAD